MSVDQSDPGRHWELTKNIIGAFFVVRRELGPWFAEYLYVRAMAVALAEQGMECAREVPYEVTFHGVPVGLYRADLVVNNQVLVEVKVADRILPAHREQTSRYLSASGLGVGLILNFGHHPSTARIDKA